MKKRVLDFFCIPIAYLISRIARRQVWWGSNIFLENNEFYLTPAIAIFRRGSKRTLLICFTQIKFVFEIDFNAGKYKE